MGMHRYRHANTSGGQRVGTDFGPSLALVEGLVELGVAGTLLAGGRPTGPRRGDPPFRFGGRKNRVGFVKGRREIAATGLIVRVQHVGPSLAAVFGSEDAT